MRNKILFVICILLVFIFIVSYPKKETPFFIEKIEKTPEEHQQIIKLKLKDNRIIEINLEDYLIGVLAAEMPASFNEEALKAQAVASRTYAIYKIENSSQNYDLVTTVANQAYLTNDEIKTKFKADYSKYYSKIENAVNSTKGLIMKYQDKVICAYYFSMSNGYTENSQNVFGHQLEYATSVESSWDKNVNNYEKEIIFSKSEFCSLLNITCNNITISNIIRNDTNHITSIQINSQIFTGIEIRKILNLRSTDFEIKINDEITIKTKGYGHGVGMSQYGAEEMSKLGYNYEEILNYYYQNISIVQI